MTTLFKITPECFAEFRKVLRNSIMPVGEEFVKFTDMDNMPEHQTLMHNLLGANDKEASWMIYLLVDGTVEKR